MSDPILDADLLNNDSAYALIVHHGDEMLSEAAKWYREAMGHESARPDQFHGAMWRALREANRFPTLRHAFQDTWPKPIPIPPVGTVRPWHRDGLNLKDDTGAIVKVRGVTAFDAFRLFLMGDLSKLETFARWTHSIGADTWRVFLMWGNTNLRSTPENRAQIGPFVDWCQAHGIRPWIVAFTGQNSSSPILLSTGEQDAHWVAVRGAQNDRCIVEVVNECWQNGGYDFAGRFDMGGIAIGCRSTPEDAVDPRQCGPLHTITNDHTRRYEEWDRQFKVLLETARMGSAPEGAPNIAATDLPPLSGEPPRLNDQYVVDAPVEGMPWLSGASQWADYVAGCELFGSGMIIHNFPELQYCDVPTNPTELEKVEAIRQSWGVIPGHVFSQGIYSREGHNQVVSAPGAIKNYAMIVWDEAWAVCVRGDIDAAVGVNGWTIVERLGFKGRIVRLVKG